MRIIKEKQLDGTWERLSEPSVMLPPVGSSDEGKILRVNNGVWSIGEPGYYKPSTGIPMLDLSSDIQDVLNRVPTLVTEFSQFIAHMHNCYLRCKDITSYITDGTFYKRIAGTDGFQPFDDIFTGDFIRMSRPISAYERTGQYQATGSQYVTIAGCNPLWGVGDSSPVTYNHVAMVPGQGEGGTQHFGRSRMNSTMTTAGGLVGSEMYTATIGAVTSSGSTGSQATINQQLYAEFGSHLKTFRALLTTGLNATGYNRFGTNSGCANSWEWQSVQAFLMSEVEVYGSTVWSSSAYDTGEAKNQFPLFRLSTQALNNRSAYYWLRDIASASVFCNSNNNGNAYYNFASIAANYVRPCFVLA